MINLRWIDEPDEKAEISARILNQLPQWFGIPESTDWYIEASRHLPMLVAYVEGQPTGFLCLDETSSKTLEIIVMGILPDLHRQGIGRRLVLEAKSWVAIQGYRYLQVKTLAESHPDLHYEGTRKFYHSMGFEDVEVFADLWGPDNPCLQMILKV